MKNWVHEVSSADSSEARLSCWEVAVKRNLEKL